MKTVNIYGEAVEGEEIEYLDGRPKNVIILKDQSGVRHVVHKETVEQSFKRKPSRAGVRFDLHACQSHGRKEFQRSKRGTSRKFY
ncbi:hypothetical protein P7D98_21865 [Enterococcus avium]|uniref:hypothetical protein n=1 Tax=Enterococcus avium TaxID=33945 RepID=UPI000C9C56C3|nr:hypothetical protein [Enterococcus avium]MBU5370051.1 hypothetical protein [Enterococcus avium]MDT2468298.1 hypothetical protein [Enterococcus avium]MDT2507717.1 hypothetical protein [Enterococcus avium]PNE49979.1 hypothetical protein AUF12_05445 [Enterococcus avium]